MTEPASYEEYKNGTAAFQAHTLKSAFAAVQVEVMEGLEPQERVVIPSSRASRPPRPSTTRSEYGKARAAREGAAIIATGLRRRPLTL